MKRFAKSRSNQALNGFRKFLLPCLIAVVLGSSAAAAEDATKPAPRRTLADNYNVTYNEPRSEAETFTGMFSQAHFYGRFRANAFRWNNDNDRPGQNQDNYALGVGASLNMRSARWHGLGFGAGLYTTHSPFWRMDQEDIRFLRAGKDVLSREDVRTSNSYDLTVPGELFLDYSTRLFSAVLGRQLHESPFTASNDTKMIPNTFDGISLQTSVVPQTTLHAAWFFQQKLRDHATAHDLITFRDESGASWANQDDAAVHRGLNYANLRAAGKNPDNEVYMLWLDNQSLPSTKFRLGAYTVPGLFATALAEVNYSLNIGSWQCAPGFRYMRQIDDEAGSIGGASLSGNVSNANPRGYRNPDSLDGALWAFRLNFKQKKGPLAFLAAYSKTEDKADIVAPWRSFPTGGFTRAMGQYNWRANTATTMLQASYDFGSNGVIPNLKLLLRYAKQDFDENKGLSDSDVLHFNLVKRFPMEKTYLDLRLRAALVDDEGSDSYQDYRAEINILF